MSQITLTGQGSTPATPVAGKLVLFVDSATKTLKAVDDTGTVLDVTGDLAAHIANATDPHTGSPTFTGTFTMGTGGNTFVFDPAAGTITPAGTASPLTIANLNLAIKGKPASGSYTTGVFGGVNTSGATFNANRMYATPLVLPREITISHLCIAVTTAVAGALGRMGIYDSDGADGGPGTLLADTGEINPTAVAAMEAILSPNLTIGPGDYWRVWYCNNASVGVIREIIYTGTVPNWLVSGNQWTARTASQTWRSYAALPSSYGTHDWGFTSNTPLVIAKVA